MGCKAFLYELFLPNGFPSSVAPEYWNYQLWDTMQQVTYFVNTVISSQAIMKFHGVGDPSKTPTEATALSVSRQALAESVSLLARVPAMTSRYKTKVSQYRLLSEILNAIGHFMEILASILTHTAVLLYGGPMVVNVSGAMGGATRAKIMQHFAKEGNNGDVSLKESNQDKGGKIVGVIIGVILLFFLASGSADENSILIRSLIMFCCLTVLHIFGNIKAVKALQIPQTKEPPTSSTSTTAKPGGVRAFMEAMFLPPGYWEGSVAESYTRYRCWTALQQLTVYPESVVINMVFWSAVYGVGDPHSSPLKAVLIDIFQVTVSAVVGLISGLPAITRRADYSKKVWKLRSGILATIGGMTRFLAALIPSQLGQPDLFYPFIVVSVCISAFAGASGTMTNADIQKNWSRSDRVGLVDINVTSSNQQLVVKLSSAALCVAYLYGPGSTYNMPIQVNLMVYFIISGINMICVYGQFRNMPGEAPLPAENNREEDQSVEDLNKISPTLFKIMSAPLEKIQPLLEQPSLRRAMTDFAESIDIDAVSISSINMYTPWRNT